jgi:hypothetical protein
MSWIHKDTKRKIVDAAYGRFYRHGFARVGVVAQRHALRVDNPQHLYRFAQ